MYAYWDQSVTPLLPLFQRLHLSDPLSSFFKNIQELQTSVDVFKSNLGRARNGVSYHPTMHRPDGSWSTDENQGEMDIKNKSYR
jgi:hypothetical protein